jgi:hypothetical protein
LSNKAYLIGHSSASDKENLYPFIP